MPKPYANPAVNSAVRHLNKEYADAFEQLRVYLERELAKLNRDGQLLVKDRFNIRMINKTILPELQAKARELGFGDVLKAQTDELKGLAKKVLGESKAIGGSAKFSVTTGENIKALLLDAQSKVIADESLVTRELEAILRRSVTGNTKWSDLVGTIQQRLKSTQLQAARTAADVTSNFHTQTRVEHFDSPERWWLYDGPRDERNRDFCAHFIGTRVTTALLNGYGTRYGRKHPLPPSISLGGWACRHELVPLTAESKDKYPVGPLSPGAARTVKAKKKRAA
jgi:hypothetical protein